MLCLTLGELVAQLEEIGGLIRDLTCANLVEVQVVGTVVEMRRREEHCIAIRRAEEGAVYVRRMPGGAERAMEDLGDLRDCVCAGLVPGLRVVNLLRVFLQGEGLRMVDCKAMGPAKMMVAGTPGSLIEIWLDREDRVNVKGGKVPETTAYVMTPVPRGDPEAFFFEDPLLGEEDDGRPYALTPGTSAVLTHVLGSLGMDMQYAWGQPQLQAANCASETSWQAGPTPTS
jgi:hypothetical protein